MEDVFCWMCLAVSVWAAGAGWYKPVCCLSLSLSLILTFPHPLPTLALWRQAQPLVLELHLYHGLLQRPREEKTGYEGPQAAGTCLSLGCAAAAYTTHNLNYTIMLIDHRTIKRNKYLLCTPEHYLSKNKFSQ